MPITEERREKSRKIDPSDGGTERRRERDPILCKGLTYGDVYSLLYGNKEDGKFLVRCRQARRPPLNFLTTVKPRALLLLGPTLYQMCFNEDQQGEERQQQRKSTQLRDGTVLRTRSIMALRRMDWQDSTRKKICWEVRGGSHRFMTQEMAQNVKTTELLERRLDALFNRLEEHEQNKELVRSLRSEASIEDLLTRLLLLSVVGSDKGWNWVNSPPIPNERIVSALMAPLTYQGVTYGWSEESSQPPLVQLWQKKENHTVFQLIGQDETTIGGVGKTTALESLQQANLDSETVWLVTLKKAYREIEKKGERMNLNQENHPLLMYIRKKYGVDLTGRQRLRNCTFLLDGFNELTRPSQRQLCQDIVDLSKRNATIIISSRIDVRVLMDIRDYAAEQTFWENIENIVIGQLSRKQQEIFWAEISQQDLEQNNLLKVIQNSPLARSPFWMSMCCNVQKEHDSAAAWWPKHQKKPAFDSDGDSTVELMLHYVLEQIRIAGIDTKAEQAGFLMTKAFPLAAYQKERELNWQSELRQDNNVLWDDKYIESCIHSMRSIFRPEKDHIGALSAFPEGQNLQHLRTEKGRKSSLIQAALNELNISKVSYGNSAALTKDTLDMGARWDFTHDNIRDFLAALHVSNVLTLLCGGYHIQEKDIDVLAVQVGWWNNSILGQIYHLAQRYIPGFDLGMPMPEELTSEEMVIFCHIMSWLCRSGWGLAQSKRIKEWCRKCYFQWNKSLTNSFKKIDEDSKVWQRYIQSYILALCEMSSYQRKNNLKEAFQNACQARHVHERESCKEVPLADGYQYLAQCKNAGFEQLMNGECFWSDVSYLLEEGDMAFADHVLQNLHRLVEISGQGEKAVKLWAWDCGYRLNVENWAQCLPRLAHGMYQILSKAKLLAERSRANQELHNIYTLGYAAKALTIRAAIGTSGAALNGLGSMLQYQRCVQECSSKPTYYKEHSISPPLTEDEAKYEMGEWYAYLFYQAIQRIQRGSQSYSACKMAELILRRRVSLEPGQLDPSGYPTPLETPLDSKTLQQIVEPLLRHANADKVTMSSFWYGRYCEERAVSETDELQRKAWLDQAERFFDSEVRRTGEMSLEGYRNNICIQIQNMYQREILEKGEKEENINLPNDIIMRSVIEWVRIEHMRGNCVKQQELYDIIMEKYFGELKKRLESPIQRLKEGFVLTPEEVKEICWRYNGAI